MVATGVPEQGHEHPRSTRPAADFELSAFLIGVSRLAGVERIGYSNSARQTDLWVFVTREDFDLNHRIYELQDRYYESAHLAPMELHIIPIDEVEPSGLPEIRYFF